MTPQPRRKKWTEAEERTLIDKYGEMSAAGTLAKMKTREKKYKPIALHVNSMHHMRDPLSYPWQWTWKDVSTKVQNMRHQYALVKQKIKKQESSIGRSCDEFDWMEGITHWSNFLKYKEVFGDVQLVFNGNNPMMVVGGENDCDGGFESGSHEMDMMQFGHLGQVADGDFVAGIDGVENGVMDLGFDYDGDECEENYNGVNNKSESSLREEFVCEDIEPSTSEMGKKRKMLKGAEKKAWCFISNQLSQLKEMEAQFELREVERENKRQRREHFQIETERERTRKLEDVENEKEARSNTSDKLRRQWIQEFEVMEQESAERERRRREEEMLYEREWEDRLNKRRLEWKKRMDEKLSQHRAEMSQIQARILHEQQNVTSQFIGLVSQWTGPPAGLSDHTGASSHYLSQMMQNLHHVNGMVHGDSRVEGDDNQEDQFIVDG